MSCETCREQMMELDVSQFHQLEHLEGCAECQAFADQIRQVEAAMGAHVQAFEQAGDFDAAWEDAQAEALETDEVPRARKWPWLFAPVLLAAVAALVVLPNWIEAPAPTVAVPAPARSPALDTAVPARVSPSPKPTPARRPSPRPRPRPTAAPAPAPSPAPSPAAPAPAPAPAPEAVRTVVRIDPSEAYTGVEVTCPGSAVRVRAVFGNGVAVVPGVPRDADCSILFMGGAPASASLRGGEDKTCAFEAGVATCR